MPWHALFWLLTLFLTGTFGTTADPAFHELARLLFERFSCPVLEVTLSFDKLWGNQ